MHNPFNTDEYYEYSKKPIISPLDFDYIPSDDSEPDREMADGGTIPFSHLSLEEEDQRDEEDIIDDLVKRKLEEEDRKFNVQQAIGIEGPGEAGSPTQGAGYNTLAGTLAALGNLGITLSNISSAKGLQVALGALTEKNVLPNVPTRSQNIRANIDFRTEEQQAQAEEVSAEYGPAGYVGATETSKGTPKGDFTFGPQLTQAEVEAIESEKQNVIDEIQQEEDAASEAASIGVSAGPSAGSGDPGGVGTGSGTGVGVGDAWKHGGQIKGYQEGDMVEEQADTTMDTAGLGPMGLVDDMGGDQVTGVADDLEMDTEEGAYVLNADTVELVGLKDLNNLVKEAIDVAIGSDIPLPTKIDPTKKVPIKISNGEFIIPAILVPIIGLENLEKMNKRGLAYREKKKEQEAPAEAPTEIAEEQAPMETAPEGIINLAEGGSLEMAKLLNKEIGT